MFQIFRNNLIPPLMKDTPGGRLKAFRERKQLTPQQVCEVADIKYTTLKTMEDGGGVSNRNLTKLTAAFPDLNAEWLLLGEGVMFKDGRALSPVADQPDPVPPANAAGGMRVTSNQLQGEFVSRDLFNAEKERRERAEKIADHLQGQLDKLLAKPLGNQDQPRLTPPIGYRQSAAATCQMQVSYRAPVVLPMVG